MVNHVFGSILHLVSSLNLPSLIVGAIIGTAVSIWLNEFTRVRRMKRLLMGPALLPSFELTFSNSVRLRMVGDYSIINMSDLPININRPHLLGYNLASRAFQFKIVSRSEEPDLNKRLQSLFADVQVPPKTEMGPLR
jgi:hypothetical protein